jgi:DNA-binding transcriptional ArsR family regulator
MTDTKETEKTLKVLGNRRRLAIIRYLRGRTEASVGSIARAIDLSLTSTSKHLNRLFIADVLERNQRCLVVYYRIAPAQKPLVRAILTQFS